MGIIPYLQKYRAFLLSVVSGLMIWLLVYAVLPVEVTESVKVEAILFIFSCYAALIVGFFSFSFNNTMSKTKYLKITTYHLDILFCLITVGFVVRWLDLFVVRGLFFTNLALENRFLSHTNYSKSSIIIIFVSLFRTLYFFPIILSRYLKIKRWSWRYFLCCFLLFFPFLEAFLLGSRRPFFEVFLIVLISSLYYNKDLLKLRKVFYLILSIFFLISISLFVVENRDKNQVENEENLINYLLNSRYNDLLVPKNSVKSYLTSENTDLIFKNYAIILLHTGQYMIHGFFEFNHIMNRENLPITKGKYSFHAIPKLFNKLEIFDEIDISNPSPRKYVYLTAFGQLYIDFRWFTIIIMYLFGVFQKYFFDKAKESIIFLPLLIYLFLINVFLPMINYAGGTGIYPIVSFLILLLFYVLYKYSRFCNRF